MQPSRGYSIHIGLNNVDPACYNGWDGQLSGCINDATDMKSIADSLGYQSLILTNGQATAANVIAQIGGAAQELTDGDILFLTYSGHGGQVPDVNGDEDEGQDETWVLYDRQLIDDELYALWGQFQAGVRIVMLSDSCHSGTVLRMMATYADLKREVRRSKAPPSPDTLAVISQLEKTLGIQGAREAAAAAIPMPAASPDGGGVATLTRPAPAPAAAPAADQIPDVARVKTMPAEIRDLVNTARAADDGSRQWIAGDSSKAMVQASVILISGCQDSQVSMDGARNGLFTEKLRQVWADGAFGGDYHQFHSQIVAKMPASQTPNFATTGVANSAFEAQKPFTIAAAAGGGGSIPTPPTTTRPTLRRGDTGPDVTYLQQKLQQQGYSITADGIFGFNTEGRVRDFQATKGLSVDGIVGQQTWQALEGSAVAPAPQPSPPSPAPSPSGAARPTIHRGSTGPDVTYLQQRLRVFNYNVSTDGIFGPMTESAVRSFQASNGLAVDGIVGQQTWAALG